MCKYVIPKCSSKLVAVFKIWPVEYPDITPIEHSIGILRKNDSDKLPALSRRSGGRLGKTNVPLRDKSARPPYKSSLICHTSRHLLSAVFPVFVEKCGPLCATRWQYVPHSSRRVLNICCRYVQQLIYPETSYDRLPTDTRS